MKCLFQSGRVMYATIKAVEVEQGYGIKWKDGDWISIEASVSLLKERTSKIIGFHGIIRDITKRMQNEQALKDEKSRFQSLIDESPLGISVLKKDSERSYLY